MSDTLGQLALELASGRVRVVDLTQPLGPETPVISLPEIFVASPGVTLEEISHYDERGPAWYWNTLTLGEHTGTHFDAPVHWITGKDLPRNCTDTLPAASFVASACVIDVVDEVVQDPDFLLTPERIELWEAAHGRVAPGSWVLLHSGWSRREGRDAFLNIAGDGPHNPGPSPDAVRMLVHDRDVIGFGAETVGTDAGQAGGFDPPFPAHTILHGAGRYGLASLCNLDRLPPTGSLLIAAPLKIVAGSGSPVRALALTPAT